MQFFDAHIHIQPWISLRDKAYQLLTKGRTDIDIERIKKIMEDPAEMINFFDKENIGRACIINYVSHKIMGFTEEVNDYAVKLWKLFPDRVIPFGGIDPILTKNIKDELNKAIDSGIRGFKLHPSHQLIRPNAYIDNIKSLEIIYTILQDRKIPLMIHTGTSIFPGARNQYSYPMYAEDIGIDFPDLIVILSHGGRPLWMQEVFFLLKRFENFYLDISGIPPLKILEYFPKLEEIKDKVLFGSDWPTPGVKSPSINAKMLSKLPLSPETLNAILYTNANRLFSQ